MFVAGGRSRYECPLCWPPTAHDRGGSCGSDGPRRSPELDVAAAAQLRDARERAVQRARLAVLVPLHVSDRVPCETERGRRKRALATGRRAHEHGRTKQEGGRRGGQRVTHLWPMCWKMHAPCSCRTCFIVTDLLFMLLSQARQAGRAVSCWHQHGRVGQHNTQKPQCSVCLI